MFMQMLILKGEQILADWTRPGVMQSRVLQRDPVPSVAARGTTNASTRASAALHRGTGVRAVDQNFAKPATLRPAAVSGTAHSIAITMRHGPSTTARGFISTS